MKMKASTVLGLVLFALVLIGIFVGALWIEMSWIPSATEMPFSLTTMQLIVAIVPVAIGIVIFVAAWFPSIRLRYGRVRVNLSKRFTPVDIQIHRISEADLPPDTNTYVKRSASDLAVVINGIRSAGSAFHVLSVPLRADFHLDFAVLRDYIFEIRRVAPLDFVVFVGHNKQFQGILEVDRFIRRYPRLALESLLIDIVLIPEGSEDHDAYALYLARILGDLVLAHEGIIRLVRSIYWKGPGNGAVTLDDLTALGAMHASFRRDEPVKAYEFMLQQHVSGVAIVESQGTFIGTLSKSAIEDVILGKLVGAKQ